MLQRLVFGTGVALLSCVAAAASPAQVPECARLPPIQAPLFFQPGEELDFDVDAMGASAGKVFLKILPLKNGLLPIELETKTNTLFSKVQRVGGGGTSFLSPKTLRPVRYVEETTENELRKTAEVQFDQKGQRLQLRWTQDEERGEEHFESAPDAVDLASAMYLIRQLPLADKIKLCFDVYGSRKLWRVEAVVEGREHVSLPLGEFEAWHISGVAYRTDHPPMRREVHLWISDDARRLPLAAVGVANVGAVRATLTSVIRPGERRAKAEGKKDLKW